MATRTAFNVNRHYSQIYVSGGGVRLSYRTSFFHAHYRNPRRNAGSVFKPLTWKPRWRLQFGLFMMCVLFPWIMAFHHRKIPYYDKLVERLAYNVYTFQPKDSVDTFDRLTTPKTIYDKELEEMDTSELDLDNKRNMPHMKPSDFAKL